VIDARLFSHQAAQVTNRRLIDDELLSRFEIELRG
jgi:hypothetical protein